MTLTLPNTIVNDTTADALPVQQNYSTIRDYINAEAVTRDGSVAMQAPLLLVGDPTQPNHAANKAYVDAVLPVGVLFPYGGIAAPGGGHWALCNGASLPQSGYPDLFNVIGNRFGTAAAGSFLLPNMAGRMTIGIDPADVDCDTVGELGGTTVPPLIQHQHNITHDHGVVTTDGQNTNHTHPVDPPTTNTTTQGAHIHTLEHRSGSSAGTIGRPLASAAAGSTIAAGTNVVGTDGDHAHSVNIVSFTSGTESTVHYHNVDVANWVGNSGNTVQTADTKYRPPYVTMSFIIRIK